MNNNQQIIGYKPGKTFIHKLNATAKLLFFVIVTVACMISYDTRLLLAVGLGSLVLFKMSDIKWKQISFVMNFIIIFSLLNLVIVFLFDPNYGPRLYGSKTIMFAFVSYEELFYLLNLALKYFCTVPLALIFLMTTDPSQFASSLNKIGVSYRISYAVSLALRYIPDVQNDFNNIKISQQARGIDLSSKAKLTQKIKVNVQLILPLIFSSLDRIEKVSTAMELRRFGSQKKRTWYSYKPFKNSDYLVLALALIILVLTVLLFKVNGGRFYNPFA
ncbi:energy-coupling factor transporter transmembrane component T [Streptococcaceae bacterium ESL0687]|nr:energy-coupling factor transporter transmembrane component T [Streptococcaceae bacterium ESL0687]